MFETRLTPVITLVLSVLVMAYALGCLLLPVCGLSAQASIDQVTQKQEKEEGRVFFSFQTESGKTQTGNFAMKETDSYSQGQVITVFYLPFAPVICSAEPSMQSSWLLLLLGVVLSVFSVFSFRRISRAKHKASNK